MKYKPKLIIVINIIALLLIIVHISDLYDLWRSGVQAYHFGAEAMGGDVYSSAFTYIAYSIVHIITLSALILCGKYQKWKLYYLLLFINLTLLLYPML